MNSTPALSLTPSLPAWVRRGALAFCCLGVLVFTRKILSSVPIYGDDHSSHLAAVHHLLLLIKNLQTDFFCPTFNLGFPMYLYYQPLPHFTAALIHVFSFGLLDEKLAFNLTVAALWTLYPLTTYLGTRRLGLGDTGALLAGLCAPLVSSTFDFGFTLNSYMGLGLYTQLYAMVLFPLCVGWTWIALHRTEEERRSSLLVVAGLMILIWLSHAFYGVATATVAVVMVAVWPSRFRRSLPRLLALGLITAGSLLFWFIPLALMRGYEGGWPWESVDRWPGYGLARVARALVQGKLFDDGQFPTLSFGLACGVLWAVVGLRLSPLLRALLVGFLLFVFFLMGRQTFGHLVDIQPANLGLQLFRYIGPVHFFGVLLAAFGLARFGQWVAGQTYRAAAPIFLVALIALPAWKAVRSHRDLFHNMSTFSLSPADLQFLGRTVEKAMQGGAPPGRIYAHPKSGTGTHLVAALLATTSDQPMGQSYGVSMHDTLGFYYLEFLDPLQTSRLPLYNFRYVLSVPDNPLSKMLAGRGSKLSQRAWVQLFLLPGRYGYFQPVDTPFAAVGRPKEIRPVSLAWLKTSLPEAYQFGRIVADEAGRPADIPLLLRAREERIEERTPQGWSPLRSSLETLPGREPPGQVLEERIGLNRYEARVSMKRAGAVALKVAYHPFWRVRVDDRPVSTLLLTPSFLGVNLPRGTHRIAFSFHNPLYQKILLLLTLLLWLGRVAFPSIMIKSRR
jgi:hypothetical protein